MADKIILTGSPLSTGHLYRSKGKIWYMTKTGKERKHQYAWETKSQWKKPMIPKDVELAVDILIYFSDNRKRDWDNYHKITMDALEGIVMENDSQIKEAHVIKEVDRENPRTEIVIHSLTD